MFDWEDWMFSVDVVLNSLVSFLLRLIKVLLVLVVDVIVVYLIVFNWLVGMFWLLFWIDIFK